MTSPTRWTPSVIPSAARFRTASSVGQKRSVDRRSTSTRFSSSGDDRSKERRPASTCATGTRSFAAASAPASVELVSPRTTTTSGPLLEERCLDRRQQVTRLLAVRARLRLQSVRRGWEFELRVDRRAHVNEDLVDTAFAQRLRERIRREELRSVPTTERIRTPPANVAKSHDREAHPRRPQPPRAPRRREPDACLVRAAPTRAPGLSLPLGTRPGARPSPWRAGTRPRVWRMSGARLVGRGR
jgi:hypothetical protein